MKKRFITAVFVAIIALPVFIAAGLALPIGLIYWIVSGEDWFDFVGDLLLKVTPDIVRNT